MNRINRCLTVFVLAVLGTAMGQSAMASTVTLTSADAGGGFSPDIPVYAYHFYGRDISLPTQTPFILGSASYTIQGVTFQPFDIEQTPTPGVGGPTVHGNLTFNGFSAPGSYESSAATPLGAGTNNASLADMLTNQAWYSDEDFAGTYLPIQVIAAGLHPGSTYQVDVFARGDSSALDANFSFLGAGSPIAETPFVEANGTYYDVVEDVVADGSGTITVQLIATDPPAPADSGEYPRIGAISVSLVPEPASLGLLAIGGVTLLRRRRA